MDASITFWWRWPVFLTSGLASRNRVELPPMVSEKTMAATNGTTAAQPEAMKIAAPAISGKHTNNPTVAIAAAASKPGLRTVRANSKRSRRKR
jgi:hypothetical protein